MDKKTGLERAVKVMPKNLPGKDPERILTRIREEVQTLASSITFGCLQIAHLDRCHPDQEFPANCAFLFYPCPMRYPMKSNFVIGGNPQADTGNTCPTHNLYQIFHSDADLVEDYGLCVLCHGGRVGNTCRWKCLKCCRVGLRL